jgi:hypothetical protein
MGIEATNAAYAVRYICGAPASDTVCVREVTNILVVGLVLLITDYFASFRQERDLIWRAPASFMKYGFLINRYLIPACLVVIYMPLSGFIGLHFSDVVRSFLNHSRVMAKEYDRLVGGSSWWLRLSWLAASSWTVAWRQYVWQICGIIPRCVSEFWLL